MKLLKQDKPMCLLYSFAMVLNESPENLLVEIGHDGLEWWWPGHMRGHHIQEMVDVCATRGYACTPIDLNPMQSPYDDGHDAKPAYNWQQAVERFKDHLRNCNGGLIVTTENGDGHACAWDGLSVYDPRGKVCGLEDFQIHQFWKVQEYKIKSS